MFDRKKVRQLIERGCGDRMDSEQTLRDSVIGGGLLEAMGWSFDKGEWAPNVPISFGTTTHHMDYSVGKDEARWVLEAKNPLNQIDRDKDVKELLSYMKQKDSPYGFLYNGRELLAFKLGSDLPFYEWSCGKEVEIFSMFSNDLFPTKLENFIRSQGALAKFQSYVKENTDHIKDQIIDQVAQNSSTPREIVDQYFPFLISLFSSVKEPQSSETQESLESYQLGLPPAGSKRMQHSHISRARKLAPHLKESERRGPLRPISLTINGKKFEVNKSNQILIKTAEWLISESKLSKQNVPIESGPDRWLINTEPIHRNGKEFFNTYKLSNGLFLEMNYGSKRINQLAKDLMKHCGHSEDSLVVEWEK